MNRHGRYLSIFSSVGVILLACATASASGSRGGGTETAPLASMAELRLGPSDLDSRLVRLAEIGRAQGPAVAAQFATANAIALDRKGMVKLLIHGAGAATSAEAESRFAAQEPAIRAHIRDLGGEVGGRTQNLIEARVPLAAVDSIPGLPEIAWIEPAPRPRLMQVTSQGVEVTRADVVQASGAEYRPSASPIRVGVLDGGFEGYQALLGQELPGSVTVRSFHPEGIGGSEHGTACAEIVHDMAPDADLYFANFDSVVDHGEAVDWLIAQQVDVITYSIGWWNIGPGDGRGVINDDVHRAMGAGIEWVVSAGNDAQVHWEATFSDTNRNGWHNYTATDHGNSVWLEQGDVMVVFLSWDDWFLSDQDYDLAIFDPAGQMITWSVNPQTGTQPPREAAGFVAPVSGTYWVGVFRYSASRDVRLEAFYDILSDVGRLQYVVPEGSLSIPADTAGAIAVGATYWSDDEIEPFSSQGPTTDGRTKPDLSAPDGVDTATYLYYGEAFYGTSASAPHVAGAIALIKARFGAFSLGQIVDILYGRASDRGAAGKDNQYGEGRLDVIG